MERFFQPIRLGSLNLKNRFIMPPIKTAYGTPEGKVTQRHLNFYNNVSQGGASLIILEPVSVLKNSKEHPKQLRPFEPLSCWKEIMEASGTVILTAGEESQYMELIGDAREPRNISVATQAGYETRTKH